MIQVEDARACASPIDVLYHEPVAAGLAIMHSGGHQAFDCHCHSEWKKCRVIQLEQVEQVDIKGSRRKSSMSMGNLLSRVTRSVKALHNQEFHMSQIFGNFSDFCQTSGREGSD